MPPAAPVMRQRFMAWAPLAIFDRARWRGTSLFVATLVHPFREARPIARLAADQMLAHGAPAGARVARRHGIPNGPVFLQDDPEIGALRLLVAPSQSDALAGYDEPPEIFEKARELRIARRAGDGEVEREVFVDAALASRDCALHGGKCLGDALASRRRTPLRSEPGRLHLDT